MANREELYAPQWVSEDQLPKQLYSEILPGLWMGGTEDDDTTDIGKPLPKFEHGVPFDAVVTLFAWAHPMPWGVEELRWGFADSQMSLVDEQRLHRVVDWAHSRWQQGDRVLIRCQAGMNRSGLVTALVLMRADYSAEEAISLLRSQRSEVVLFNSHFVDYLLDLDSAAE